MEDRIYRRICAPMRSAARKLGGKRTWLIVQMTLSFVFLFLVFRRFDWGGFRVLIENLPLAFYLAMLLLAFGCQLLYALKWYCVLRSMGSAPAYLDLVRITFIGFFFANFAPSTFGQDFIRVYYLGQKAGYMEVGLSVFLDRYFGLLAAIAIALALCCGLAAQLPQLAVIRNILIVLLALFVAGLVAARLPVETGLRLARRKFPKRAGKFERLEKWVGCCRKAGNKIYLIPASAVLIAAIFLITALIYGHFFALMGGVRLPLLQTLTAVLVITIFSNIPIAVNGIGLREHLHYLLLSSMGLSKELAVGASLMVFSFLLVFSLLGLCLWLASRGGCKRLQEAV